MDYLVFLIWKIESEGEQHYISKHQNAQREQFDVSDVHMGDRIAVISGWNFSFRVGDSNKS